jgi:hypothetical protein
MTRFGSEILESEFPNDDGLANPDVISALIDFASASTPENDMHVLAALIKAPRLLIPVVAQVETVNHDGTEKDSSIMSVTFESSDGRIGLPVFSGIEALSQWDPEARPIPRSVRDIAKSCLAESFDAILLDMSSDHRYVINKRAMQLLAESQPSS